MKTSLKAANWALNIFTGLAVLYIALLLGHRFFSAKATPGVLQGIKAGTMVPLANANWSQHDSTFILALSTTCHFCKESTGFYKALLQASPSETVHLIAVFPEPLAEARAYLESAQIKISDIRQADFGTLGVAGTPTLILVDQAGHVRSSWIGKLSPSDEEKVFEALGVNRNSNNRVPDGQAKSAAPLSSNAISPLELHRLLREDPTLSVVDVRERTDYQKGHLAEWPSIPIDELEARATHEMKISKTVVVYCHYCPPCENQKAAEGSMTACTMAAFVLRGLGYSDIRLVSEDLEGLKTKGFPVVGGTREN